MTAPTVNVLVNGQIVDGSLALKDRTFRNAWQLDGDVITVDMTKARELHKDRLREARKPLFAEQDTLWFIAAEKADKAAQTAVAAQKKKLRDVTADARIESATTPEALAALTLDELMKE